MHYGVEHNISMELYQKYQADKTGQDPRTQGKDLENLKIIC